MRTKRALYNNFAAALAQITFLVFGLILPRMIISTYGSEINGLVSSIKQMVSYLRYLEMGITSSLIFTLYRPMANRDYADINPLITRTKKEYEKISFGYFIGVILLAFLYPFMLKEDIGYGMVALLVFILGLQGALDLFTLSKYRVLLEADQKAYVINFTTTGTIVIQSLTMITLLLTNQSIYLVILVPALFLPIRSVFLGVYIRKTYKDICYKVKPSNIKLDSRKDAFISGLSDTLNISIPIILISLLVSLEMASVYSVYSLVFMGLTGIIIVFISGMRAAFGNMFAREEIENIVLTSGYYELILYMLLATLYSVALALIIPFVRIYISDAADINYIYPSIGLLFTIWSVAYNSGTPYQTIINASGKWKYVTKVNITQFVYLIVLCISLGYLFGVNGILIGMIIVATYKTFFTMYITNRRVLNISSKTSLLRIMRIYVIIAIVNAPIVLGYVVIEPNNFLEWIICAIAVLAIALITTLTLNLIFDWRKIKEINQKYIKMILKIK